LEAILRTQQDIKDVFKKIEKKESSFKDKLKKERNRSIANKM
jgi:hypothetical protein